MRPIIAKLTRPSVEGIVARRRLFARLNVLAGKKIVWISAPAGIGKTTLVASWLEAKKIPCIWYQADEGDSDLATVFSYLGTAAKYAAPRFRTPLPLFTREYQSAVSVFTKRYCEILFSRLKPPFCFVIDNYQDVPLTSQFHGAVRDGLSMVPAGLSVIIISRSDPPPELSRLQINGQLVLIKGEDLGFTFEEARALMTAHAKKRPSDAQMKEVFRRTAGWAAGLVLYAATASLGGGLAEGGEIPSELIFDYFATEVFDRTDDELRAFLLATAFLPRITARAADEITGGDGSDLILSRFSRTNFFTERHATADFVTYQYHPLFREFLLERGRKQFSRDELFRIRKKAAMLLESEGQTEDAARLLIEAEDWQGLTSLIRHHAEGLMAAGRFRTLVTWIEAIPGIIVDNDGWLLYWKASCRITGQPVDARRMLESAYALFLTAQEPTGSFLCWAGIVNTYLYEWRAFQPLDQWINEFGELRQRFDGFPSPEVEERASSAIFAAMMFRQPQHPELPYWTSRVQANMQSTPDQSHRMFIGYNLLLYYLWTSRINEASALVGMFAPVFKKSTGAVLPRLMWFRAVVLYYIYVSDPENGLKTVEQGLELAEDTGVHYLDMMFHGAAIYHAAILGDLELGRRHLERMVSLRDQRGSNAEIYYASQSSLVALLQGDIDTAVAQAELSVQLSKQAGVPLIINTNRAGLAFILSETDQEARLRQLIAELRIGAASTKSEHLEAWCLSIEAQIALRDGNDALFREKLEKAIAICKRTGLRLLTWQPTSRTQLCAKALELDLETDFIKALIRLNNLTPDRSQAVPDAWPYPLKIHTLGGFELIQNDRPVVFGGKVQQKPLAMLKAIIALGGRDVDDKVLTDALWPETEGDLGRRSFDTTLHRLRKLLPDERIIHLQEGKVSLDPRYCWIDVWAFDALLLESEKRRADDGEAEPRGEAKKGRGSYSPTRAVAASPVPRVLQRALLLYRGHFLPSEEGEPWALSLRERLRSKYMSAVSRLGRHLMESGDYELAVAVYLQALEVDDLSEEFYQNLMLSYLKLDRRAEAATTYRRCCTILLKKLGLTPSAKTEEIYHSVTA